MRADLVRLARGMFQAGASTAEICRATLLSTDQVRGLIEGAMSEPMPSLDYDLVRLRAARALAEKRRQAPARPRPVIAERDRGILFSEG